MSKLTNTFFIVMLSVCVVAAIFALVLRVLEIRGGGLEDVARIAMIRELDASLKKADSTRDKSSEFHYTFYELLDAPSARRRLPVVNLATNPAILEKERLKREKRAKLSAKKKAARKLGNDLEQMVNETVNAVTAEAMMPSNDVTESEQYALGDGDYRPPVQVY